MSTLRAPSNLRGSGCAIDVEAATADVVDSLIVEQGRTSVCSRSEWVASTKPLLSSRGGGGGGSSYGGGSGYKHGSRAHVQQVAIDILPSASCPRRQALVSCGEAARKF